MFTLRPGEKISRKHLHDKYGGKRQGGISPSQKTPNIFIFSDPDVGNQHGYTDGWFENVFHYTGEGQTGDQEFKHGNRAILKHNSEKRKIHLFDGAKGIVTYQCELELKSDDCVYFTDAPETDGRHIRQVIVFKLVPKLIGQGTKPDSELLQGLFAIRPKIQNVDIENHNTEKYVVAPKNEPATHERVEAQLIKRFEEYAKKNNIRLTRNKFYPENEAKPLFSDIFCSELNLLIEAKGTVTREALRSAVGQLLDYRRFFPAKPNSELPSRRDLKLGILVPSKPRQDLLSFIDSLDIKLIWQDGEKFWEFYRKKEDQFFWCK